MAPGLVGRPYIRQGSKQVEGADTMQQKAFRSSTTTQGRRMAGARALWRATGMKSEDFWQAHRRHGRYRTPSRQVPCICKVAPASDKYHVEDVARAGEFPPFSKTP